jgi:hypothetical protein
MLPLNSDISFLLSELLSTSFSKTNDGKYKEDIVSILEEQVNFFEKLFTSEGWDSDSAAYLLNNLEKKLSPFPRFEHKCNYSPILRFTK